MHPVHVFVIIFGIFICRTDALVSNTSDFTSHDSNTEGQSSIDFVSTPLHSVGNTIVASKSGPEISETSTSFGQTENHSIIASGASASAIHVGEVFSSRFISSSQTEVPGSSSPYPQLTSSDYMTSENEEKPLFISDFSSTPVMEALASSYSASVAVQIPTQSDLSSSDSHAVLLSSTTVQESSEHSLLPFQDRSNETLSESTQWIFSAAVSSMSNFPTTSESPESVIHVDHSFMWTISQEQTVKTYSPTNIQPSSTSTYSSFSIKTIEDSSELVEPDVVSMLVTDPESSFKVKPTATVTIQSSSTLPTNDTTGTFESQTTVFQPDITYGSNGTESPTSINDQVIVKINDTQREETTTTPVSETTRTHESEATTRNTSVPIIIPTLLTTRKNMKNATVMLWPTTPEGKTETPRSTTIVKTKETKNSTVTASTSSTGIRTRIYTKPTEPTKYPLKPGSTPTPKRRYTTERTTSRNEVDNETPWRPPVYISAKIKMTLAELCSELHDFSTIILRVLEAKMEDKAYQYTVVVLEELQCTPDMYHGKYRREAEVIVNFFLVDPRGKYDREVTEKLADLIQETELDVSGTSFVGKIVAVKVHGVSKKAEDRVGEARSEPPADSKELSGGLIALAVVASIATVLVMIFVILQLMVCRRRMGMKKMRQVYEGSRPSLECHSIVDSIQLTGITTFTEQGSRPSFAYYNPALHIGDPNKDFSSNPLDVIGIEEMLEEPETIEDEFLMLPNVMPKLSEVPVGAEDKNRYANVIPFPPTRVSLMKLDGEEHSEYINANFIRGYGAEADCYIATQAPLEDTRGDFWRMVWEQQSRVVIMLTDLEEQGMSKCAEYWPNTNGADKVRIYGDYEIILQRREVTPNWIQSTMILKHLDRNLCREIQHYWLTCWPDQGTLNDPTVLLRFLLHVRPDMEEYRGPTVVHCSPGTGRTGTLLAVDICMRSLDDTETADVLGTVHMLRQDRAGAVQTQEQYFFIYQALLEYAVRFCNSTRSYKSSLTSLEMQHH